jgi:hypothetical protein
MGQAFQSVILLVRRGVDSLRIDKIDASGSKGQAGKPVLPKNNPSLRLMLEKPK